MNLRAYFCQVNNRVKELLVGKIRSWRRDTVLHCSIKKDILASDGLGVCDGAHWLDVMKKAKSHAQAKLPQTYSRDPLM